MSNTLHVEIISPTKLVYSGEVAMAEVPGIEGDMGVLPQHAPTLTLLREGVIALHNADKSITRFAVKSGYADIAGLSCTILSEKVEAA